MLYFDAIDQTVLNPLQHFDELQMLVSQIEVASECDRRLRSTELGSLRHFGFLKQRSSMNYWQVAYRSEIQLLHALDQLLNLGRQREEGGFILGDGSLHNRYSLYLLFTRMWGVVCHGFIKKVR
jgi:hypothetical protein